MQTCNRCGDKFDAEVAPEALMFGHPSTVNEAAPAWKAHICQPCEKLIVDDWKIKPILGLPYLGKKPPVWFLHQGQYSTSVIAKGEKRGSLQYFTYAYQKIHRTGREAAIPLLTFYEQGSDFERQLTPFYAPPSAKQLKARGAKIKEIAQFRKFDTFWETDGKITVNSIGPGSHICDTDFRGFRYILEVDK